MKPLNICLVCDFFYPNPGGVEVHIWSLCQCLLRLGHKVVVVTHDYGERFGVRYMFGGLKVYYIPHVTMVFEDVFPTLATLFPAFRQILIREEITLVHGHQSASVMMLECLVCARTMGCHVCFTDHSLYNFTDPGAIALNALLGYIICDVDMSIAVSEECRNNLILRTRVPPESVKVIHNAVDSRVFLPCPSRRRTDQLQIAVVTRFVPRKGTLLLSLVIAGVLAARPRDVRFVIVGDGPDRPLLEDLVRSRGFTTEQVRLSGFVPHRRVAEILQESHMLLSTSLMESFCMALLEAASCGLYVVSTAVGGVREVLPVPRMMTVADATTQAMIDATLRGLSIAPTYDCWAAHGHVKRAFSWERASAEVERVYSQVLQREIPSLPRRVGRYFMAGWAFFPVALVLFLWNLALWLFLEWLFPRAEVERVPSVASAVQQHLRESQRRPEK